MIQESCIPVAGGDLRCAGVRHNEEQPNFHSMVDDSGSKSVIGLLCSALNLMGDEERINGELDECDLYQEKRQWYVRTRSQNNVGA